MFSVRPVGRRWMVAALAAIALVVVVCLKVAAAHGAAAPAGASSSADPSLPVGGPALRRLLASATPVASMATPTSQTYRRPDGSFVTRVFPQDAGGALRAVAHGFLGESANGWATSFPSDLSSPIRVAKASSWVSMRLRDADGAAAADGSTITYKNALKGVDAEYDSAASSIGELIHLTGSAAPSRLTFDVQAADGLRAARQPNGVIAFTRGDGSTAVELRPSYAYADSDPAARRPVATTLTPVGGGRWRLELAVDPSWLSGALTQGPVTIDPTVQLEGAALDCPLSTDVASTSYCGNSGLWVGYASPGDDNHSLVRWDLSAVPAGAAVLEGDFGLYQEGVQSPVAKRIDMHRVTRAWTSGASWNSYDGTHAWTTAGGDYDPTPVASASVPAQHAGWVDWYSTRLVQQWVTGGLPNNGVLFKDQYGTAGPQGQEQFYSNNGAWDDAEKPELDVVWAPRTGRVDSYTFEHQALDPRTSADVNVANGNLLLATQGITAPGTGLNLELDNYNNSLAAHTDLQAEGIRGTASLGRDVRLVKEDAGTVAFYRGDGYAAPFTGAVTTGQTTTYTAPADLPGALLSHNSSTCLYTLTLPAGLPSLPGQALTLIFTDEGKLKSIADGAGHTITLGYYSEDSDSGLPPLGDITDTDNADWDVTSNYVSDGYIDAITNPGGTHWNWTYGHNDTDYLTQFTAGDSGQSWHYDYDSSDRLTTITTPDARVTKVTYSATTSKVASIVNTTNSAHTTGPTTTYAYSSPTSPCQPASFDASKTVVARPDGSSTTYCTNNYAQVTYDTDNPGAATPSGEWFDLANGYTQGSGTHGVTLSGADAGSGVKTMSLVEVGGATLASTTLPCDPRNAPNPTACPHAATAAVTFSPAGLAEGAHSFEEVVTDYAGHTTASAPWTVSIDRTAPGLAANLGAGYDSDDQVVDVSWDGATDPALADGTAGSGVAHYSYRYQADGGAWSAWATSDDAGFTIAGHAGEAVHVQVQAIDGAGNTGATYDATATATADTLGDPGAYSYDLDDPTIEGDDGSMPGTFDPGSTTAFCNPDPDVDDDCGAGETDNGADTAMAREPSLAASAGGGSGAFAPLLAPGDPNWGLAAQGAGQLTDQYAIGLRARTVRIVVPWDVAQRPYTDDACGRRGDVNSNYANLASWVAHAQANNQQMLISFGRCADRTEYDVLPTPSQYKRAITRFLGNSRFRDIRYFTAWNEPNSDGQPTSFAKRRRAGQPLSLGPQRAAQFWATFSLLCHSGGRSCSVAAGEFVDSSDFTPEYFADYKRSLTHQPTVWAFHPYVAANSASYTRFDRFISGTARTDVSTQPPIWITEAGGIVHSNRYRNNTPALARAGGDRLITDVVNRSPRISRLYYYALLGDPPTVGAGFDSGLLDYQNRCPRDMYNDYLQKVSPGAPAVATAPTPPAGSC